MSYVAKLYGQIGEQLRGLLWKDGGPVIGIQLENEYAGPRPEAWRRIHPRAQETRHRQRPRCAPLHGHRLGQRRRPAREVLPVFGGYPDAPWDGARGKLPPSEVYLFRFGSRVSGNMGMIGGRRPSHRAESDASDTPFITAEMGGGVQDTYHRRPVIEPDDVAAMMPVMLGSGVNLYGTYMFQGGENPDGKLTTLQESHATGYPNDVPVKSYDFQAPLGEFGQERESLRKLKVFDYFLNALDPTSRTMSAARAPVSQKNPSDFSVIRAAVRSRGDHGFLFVNNYVRGSPMPAQTAAQFEIQLTRRSPDHPRQTRSRFRRVHTSSGRLTSTSALPHCSTAPRNCSRVWTTTGTLTWVFEEIPGITPQFVLTDADGLSVDAPGAEYDVRKAK